MTETVEKEVFLITKEQVDACAYSNNNGIPLCEDESAVSVWAYGHIDPADYATAVNLMDLELLGDHYQPENEYSASDVDHMWGVAYRLVNATVFAEDEWFIDLKKEPEENAVPITLVWR